MMADFMKAMTPWEKASLIAAAEIGVRRGIQALDLNQDSRKRGGIIRVNVNISSIIFARVFAGTKDEVEDGEGDQESQAGDQVDAGIPPGLRDRGEDHGQADDRSPFSQGRAGGDGLDLRGGELAAVVDVGCKGDDPGKHHAKKCSAKNVFEGFGGSVAFEDQGDDDSIRRNEQG